MNVHLMYPDADFSLKQEAPPNTEALIQDLELSTLFEAMACGDAFLYQAAKVAVLSGLGNNPDTIKYRQSVLQDTLRCTQVIQRIYDITIEAAEEKRRNWYGIFTSYPSSILQSGVNLLELYLGMLVRIRNLGNEHSHQFRSLGFQTLFAMLDRELSEEYFATIQRHLRDLRFPDGTFLSASLGAGNVSAGHTLRYSDAEEQGWFWKLLQGPDPLSFRLSNRDEIGARILGELRNRGINEVANAVAQSADHVLSFFAALQTELAFYLGCVNLHQKLEGRGVALFFPTASSRQRKLVCKDLTDVCLALVMKGPIVPNSMNADAKQIVVITGANQGGKSTFMRAIGLAQLMMQAGMFVAAKAFSADVCSCLFTHYKREEDREMKSGKFDEELSRMSTIIDQLGKRAGLVGNSMILFNESFAATNEREGTEIALQVVKALLRAGGRVIYVTHMLRMAHDFVEDASIRGFYLRAERQNDGSRPFKLVEGQPLTTSYGEDLYREIFSSS